MTLQMKVSAFLLSIPGGYLVANYLFHLEFVKAFCVAALTFAIWIICNAPSDDVEELVDDVKEAEGTVEEVQADVQKIEEVAKDTEKPK